MTHLTAAAKPEATPESGQNQQGGEQAGVAPSGSPIPLSSATVRFLRRRVSRMPFSVGDMVAALVMLFIVGYGAFLRLDAITLTYGPMTRPAWLRSYQATRPPTSGLRPAGFTWSPAGLYEHRDGPPTRYRSDPYTYLQYARQMRSFYAAHRREPLFPFATKIFLRLLHNQDVAVSFASAAFSVAAIVATLVLGWSAFSWWVGAAAALAMAVEYDVVTSSIEGWRDDAFVFMVLLSALALLRLARAPSLRNALLMGVAGGLACLVRITALSFLLPALAWLFFTGAGRWRERGGRVGLAIVAMGAIVAPFLINCWLTFGDPFHAINVHADVYRAAERQGIAETQTTVEYLGSHLRSRPFQTLDTFVQGMTVYPFQNKWSGFSPWAPWLGTMLSIAALGGLILLVGSPQGRLLLVVLASSLVPYAFTWTLISDWRFTEHAYPFFLIAACAAIWQPFAVAAARRARRVQVEWKDVAFWSVVASAVALAAWVAARPLPFLAVREALLAKEDVTIAAGSRDGAFFASGWSSALQGGAATARASASGRPSVLRLPLPPVSDYAITMRVDPFPRPSSVVDLHPPTVRVLLNDQLLANLQLQWNPERMGAYEIAVPRRIVDRLVNRLAIVAVPHGGTDRVTLWYVRIRPLNR